MLLFTGPLFNSIFLNFCSIFSFIRQVRVALTEAAVHFTGFRGGQTSEIVGAEHVYRDAQEWASWQRMGDDVLHIELRRWADILVVAPLGANSLAKIANGLCDNLVTCIARVMPPETLHSTTHKTIIVSLLC